jgi:hypothetical protein
MRRIGLAVVLTIGLFAMPLVEAQLGRIYGVGQEASPYSRSKGCGPASGSSDLRRANSSSSTFAIPRAI